MLGGCNGPLDPLEGRARRQYPAAGGPRGAVKGGILVFRVEEAGRDRLEVLLGMLRERAAWLEARNWKMWEASRLTVQDILKRYHDPAAYLAFDGAEAVDEARDEAVGGFLLVGSDDHYWSEKAGDKALYLHKFVVRLGFGGRGYSGRMLEWVKDFGRAAGMDFIRLDYQRGRGALAGLYLAHGFLEVGEMKNRDGDLMVKAECVLDGG